MKKKAEHAVVCQENIVSLSVLRTYNEIKDMLKKKEGQPD